MERISSWLDSAKQIAQNAIKDKLDSATNASGQTLLNILHDVFAELSHEKRLELFALFEQVFHEYKAQEVFDFEVIWQKFVKQAAVQEMAVSVSKRFITNLINRPEGASKGR